MKSHPQDFKAARTRTSMYILILLTPLLQFTSSASVSWNDYYPKGKNFTSLVVFGDSYSDDGHPRKAEYQKSFSIPPAVGGRYCNGPVWNEFLSISLSSPIQTVSLLNYAYNGAHINNQLTNNSVPDTYTQMNSYLDDLEAFQSTQDPHAFAESRTLHIIWIGINPLVALWRGTLLVDAEPGTLDQVSSDMTEHIDRQIAELTRQVDNLIKNPNVIRLSPQFIILTPPLLHTTQLVRNESRRRSETDTNLADSYIKLMEKMCAYFGQALVRSINLVAQVADSKERQVSVFDTVKVWSEVQDKSRQ